MKLQTDRHRSKRSFEVGEWVYLKLQPYRQKLINHKILGKLAPKYYGPFQVLQKIGKVAYKLNLSSNALIHLLFQVSCLKAKLGQQIIPIPTLLQKALLTLNWLQCCKRGLTGFETEPSLMY